MTVKKNIEQPSEADFKKWKELYGKVHELEIPISFETEDGEKFEDETDAQEHAQELVEGKRSVTTVGVKCWLRPPSRKVIDMASSMASKSPMKFGEIILKNCWLGGDEKIQTDDDLFMAANGILGELINIKTAKLKKL